MQKKYKNDLIFIFLVLIPSIPRPDDPVKEIIMNAMEFVEKIFYCPKGIFFKLWMHVKYFYDLLVEFVLLIWNQTIILNKPPAKCDLHRGVR